MITILFLSFIAAVVVVLFKIFTGILKITWKLLPLIVGAAIILWLISTLGSCVS